MKDQHPTHTDTKSNSKLGVKAQMKSRRHMHDPKVKAAAEYALNRWQHHFIEGAARIRRERAPQPSALSSPHSSGVYNFVGVKQGKGFETLSYCRQCLCDVGLGAHKDCVYQLETMDWEKLPKSKLEYLAICVENVPCCDCAACDNGWDSESYPRDKEKGLQCSDACDKCNAMEEPGSTEDPPSKQEVEEMHPGPNPLEIWKVHLAGNVAVQWAEENCIPPDEEQPTEFNDWIGNKLTCLMSMVGPARAYHCACNDDHSGACSKRDDIEGKADMKEWEVQDGPSAQELIEGSFSGGEGSSWFCSPPGEFSVMGSELFEDMDPVMDKIIPIIAEEYAVKERKRIKSLSADDANAAIKKMSPQEAKLVSVEVMSEGLIESESEKVEDEVEKMLEEAEKDDEKAKEMVKKVTEKKEKADAKFQDAKDLEAESKFAKQEAKKLDTDVEQANTKLEDMEMEAKSLEKKAQKLEKKSEKLEKEAEKLEGGIEARKEAASEEEKLDVLKDLEDEEQVQAKTELKAEFAHEEAEKKEEAAAKMEEKANDAEQQIDKMEEKLEDAKDDSVEMAKEAEKKEEQSEKLTKEASEDMKTIKEIMNQAEEETGEVAKDITAAAFKADTLPEDGKLNAVEFVRAEEIVMKDPLIKHAFKDSFALVVFDTNEDGLVSKDEMTSMLKDKLLLILKEKAKEEGWEEGS